MPDSKEIKPQPSLGDSTQASQNLLQRLAFHRSCSSHFVSHILPAFQRLEISLRQRRQKTSIKQLYQYDRNLIRGGLVLDLDIGVQRALYATYNCEDQTLIFVETDFVAQKRFILRKTVGTFSPFENLTELSLNEILSGFVASTIVEFRDDADQIEPPDA